MRKTDIPFYNDPEDFENGLAIKFPCNTQYMVYNPMLHRYFLTEQALINNEIHVQGEFGGGNKEVQEFIKKVSEQIYNFIQYKAGFSRYQTMMYRIATAPKTIYPDQYFMRKQFEDALIAQARYLLINGDKREAPTYNFDQMTNKLIIKPEDEMRDNSHISSTAMQILETLGLLRWFSMVELVKLDLNKY